MGLGIFLNVQASALPTYFTVSQCLVQGITFKILSLDYLDYTPVIPWCNLQPWTLALQQDSYFNCIWAVTVVLVFLSLWLQLQCMYVPKILGFWSVVGTFSTVPQQFLLFMLAFLIYSYAWGVRLQDSALWHCLGILNLSSPAQPVSAYIMPCLGKWDLPDPI